ncbi:hypothetical protein ABTM32_22005 [Acinetobacter baumannii]
MHSSGTESLDNAALQAVRAATPFTNVEHYLNTAQDFQVDILFALPD